MSRFRKLSIAAALLATSFALVELFDLAAAPSAVAANRPDDQPENPFSKNCKVTFTEDMMIVESDGIPNHKTATYPNKDNPNRIEKQHYRFEIPRNPKRAEKTTPTPFGPIGVALNGIPFYNQYNAEGQDAVRLEIFDSCCGHPDPGNRYHYHKFPVCVKSPFKDTPGKHSPLVGYMFDGFPIYGPRGDHGQPPTDLDECNGHSDSERGYHYHATAEYPYLIGAYRGVVNERMLERPPGRPGQGGPGQGGPGGRPPGGGPPGGGRRGPPPGGRPPGGGPPPPDKGF
jgi:YHYH protein